MSFLSSDGVVEAEFSLSLRFLLRFENRDVEVLYETEIRDKHARRDAVRFTRLTFLFLSFACMARLGILTGRLMQSDQNDQDNPLLLLTALVLSVWAVYLALLNAFKGL